MALNGSASINHQIIIAYLNTNINNFTYIRKASAINSLRLGPYPDFYNFALLAFK